MARRLRTWSVWGIPVHLNTSWLLIAALVTWSLSHGYFPRSYPGFSVLAYWTMGITASLLLFVCVLLHELGHSLAARDAGIPVACVTLFIFGGVASITGRPQRPAVELRIALAGPLVSALLAFGCLVVAAHMPVRSTVSLAVWAVVRYLAFLNIGLLVFNLLPGFPLDGGRILRSVIWAVSGNLRTATRIASLAGATMGVGLLALGVWAMARGVWVGGLWYLLLGWFLRNSALASYRYASE
jgi:Zn-dependent protease